MREPVSSRLLCLPLNPSFVCRSVRLCRGPVEGDDVLPPVTVHLGHLLSFFSSLSFYFLFLFISSHLLSLRRNSDSRGKWANKLSTRLWLIPDFGMRFLSQDLGFVGASNWVQTKTSGEIDDLWIRSSLSTIWSCPSFVEAFNLIFLPDSLGPPCYTKGISLIARSIAPDAASNRVKKFERKGFRDTHFLVYDFSLFINIFNPCPVLLIKIILAIGKLANILGLGEK